MIKLMLLALVLGVSFFSCRRSMPYTELSGCVWNTTYTIKYSGPVELSDSVTGIMHDIEMSLSPFNPQSLISEINRGETDSVNSDIVAVFNMSREINERSAKAFDPTLSPLINLWGFGFQKISDTMRVTPGAVADALLKVGIDSCRIVNGRLCKKHPDTTFNFSAITKGYGCDKIGEMLQRNNCENFMVEIGGELRLKGLNDRGKPWRVMIEYPNESRERDYQGLITIVLTDCGVATSGNYRNYRDTENGRVGHTIDPATGYPVETSTLSATVVAPTCAMADGLATACMAMPSELALQMIQELADVECMLVVNVDDGVKVVKSAGFPI